MDRIPNLFVPGFQKCATTAIFRSLIQHPEVGHATQWFDLNPETHPKETHFFNAQHQRGRDFYAQLYAGAEERWLIDATPIYLNQRAHIQRMREMVPEARLIVSMRDPVERVVSAWNHWTQTPLEERWPISLPDGTFEENMRFELEHLANRPGYGGFLKQGIYAAQIESLLEFFPRDQVLFTFAEWLSVHFEREMGRLLNFLELEPCSFHEQRWHQRERTVPDPDETTEELLRTFYRPWDQRLRELVEAPLPWG